MYFSPFTRIDHRPENVQCAQSQRGGQIKITHITSNEGLEIANVRTIASYEAASLLVTHTASLILLLLVVLLLLKERCYLSHTRELQIKTRPGGRSA